MSLVNLNFSVFVVVHSGLSFINHIHPPPPQHFELHSSYTRENPTVLKFN
eukprot:TRINITY_DN15606_c0_g1_i1.p2 TRINITY_DN15606_c0_g1~~TRINITY_DN15606_c0_g1_i1.p2  ORF type:complete len:50 (-),score=8.67 TRINITY_DN15606_c0_g1_i1:60-209(-)